MATQFAIIAQGGKQYKVIPGVSVAFERMPGEKDTAVVFDKVLMIADEEGQDVKIGAPFVEGSKVSGKILEQTRAKKVIGLKYKCKVHNRKKYGFRAMLTKVGIEKIELGLTHSPLNVIASPPPQTEGVAISGFSSNA